MMVFEQTLSLINDMALLARSPRVSRDSPSDFSVQLRKMAVREFITRLLPLYGLELKRPWTSMDLLKRQIRDEIEFQLIESAKDQDYHSVCDDSELQTHLSTCSLAFIKKSLIGQEEWVPIKKGQRAQFVYQALRGYHLSSLESLESLSLRP